MKTRACVFLSLALLLTLLFVPGARIQNSTTPDRHMENPPQFASHQLFFEQNMGQTDQSVHFYTRGPNHIFYLSSTGSVMHLLGEDGNLPSTPFSMHLLDADAACQARGLSPQPSRSNYFIGNDPEQWISDVPHYAKVAYKEVYPCIDLVYYFNDHHIEFDFVVHPGADPREIGLGFPDADQCQKDEQGNLLLAANGHDLVYKAPVAWQDTESGRKKVDAQFAVLDNQVRFELGAYDPTDPLIIDPQVVYATYLGGSRYDAGKGIAVDDLGFAYVTGYTQSVDFPVQNAMQGELAPSMFGNSVDVFVTKLNREGTGLVYSTYIGGRWDDRAVAIAVDDQGKVYITGETASSDDKDTPEYEGFPVVNAFQDKPGNPNFLSAFITVLNNTGNAILYSSYLSGRAYDDVATDIAVDAQGNAYITGTNHSASFPTKNAFISDKPGYYFNAFAAKFNPYRSGDASLVYSTYLGGYSNDYGVGIAVDHQGCAYVIGTTNSDDYPTTANPIRTGPNEKEDVFVTKLSADGRSAIYSTYIGGAGADIANGIAVDENGSAFISVSGGRDGYPLTPGNYNPSPIIAVVSKLLPNGSGFDYSVPAPTRGRLAVDDSGRVYIASYSYIIGLAALTADGKDTLFTAGKEYRGNDIAVDKDYNMYVVSSTDETLMTTTNAFQPLPGGQLDAFVRKLKQNPKKDLEVTPNPIVFPLTLPGQISRETVRVSNPSDEDIEIQNLQVEPTTFFAIENPPDLPLTLSSREFVEFQVAYAYDGLAKHNTSPASAGTGSLVIVSDAETPVLDVPLLASGIIVNVTGDAPDYDINDGICDTDPDEPGNQCTLRAAIENVNAQQDDEVTTVYIRVSEQNDITIKPSAPLPAIEYPIRFDVLESDRVLLDGSNAGSTDGLEIRSGYCLLKNFIFSFWKGNGLVINGGEFNYIEHCTFKDNMSVPQKGIAGVVIQNSNDNTIRQTAVYGNRIIGIIIVGESSTGNVVENCSIGYDHNGSPGSKLQHRGVMVHKGSENKIRNNIIGNHGFAGLYIDESYKTIIENNHIKNNAYSGIYVTRSANETEIKGNIIGRNKKGEKPESNGYGIKLIGGATLTHIHNNVVSGNTQVGIMLGQESNYASQISETTIEKNMIGLDQTGQIPLPNLVGIELVGNCQANTIQCNTISGNEYSGINILKTGNRLNEIIDNKIGTDTTGTQTVGECKKGIEIFASAGVIVMGNTISGNLEEQIDIDGIKTGLVQIIDNRIGTNAHGDPFSDHQQITGATGIKCANTNVYIEYNILAYMETGISSHNNVRGNIRYCKIHHNRIGIHSKTPLEIMMNEIYKNDDGIKISNTLTSPSMIAGNRIYENYWPETGIHLTDANATVIGNSIYGDAGAGIVVEGKGSPVFHKNNIMDNTGFGLHHRGTVQTIDARDNWWGSASGPSSAGPGSGDEVSAGVDYANWRQTQTSLVAFAENDTCLATIGYLFPVALYFQNWVTPNDEIFFKASADRPWFYLSTEKTVTLENDWGGRSQVLFMIPFGTPPGTLAQVEISAVSNKDGSKDTARFVVAAGSMELSTISLLPDSVVVMPGDTVKFSAEGYNQFSRSVEIAPEWSCTGGSIDENGLFIAGKSSGTFTVTVTDANTGLTEQANVLIVEDTAVEPHMTASPEAYELQQNYPNPFNPSTTIHYSIPEQTHVTLEIYNIVGQKIRTLVREMQAPGQYVLHWNAREDQNRTVTAGIYFYHIRTERYQASRKMLLLR
ncbi:T9SS type A sorting domain-containing protein [candidate division KSB1 bacterium]|nr:T9SS type A sorting domain-containing protein [candidate division KSB1 bacterium]